MIDDYESVVQDQLTMEFLSVCGFFRKLPFRFHMDEINRFGAMIGRCAEANHLAYITQVDNALGPVRVFPVKLLLKVYQLLSAQQGWPKIDDPAPLAIEDSAKTKETLKAREKLSLGLREVIAEADDVEVLEAMSRVNAWLESDAQRLRASLAT